MTDIVMPRLSDSMTEGTVVRWLKSPGDAIRRGEPLAEIETDKATITYESDLDGVIAQLTVAEGQTVPVGTPIAYVEQQSAAAPAPMPLPAEPQQQEQPPMPIEPLPLEPAAPQPSAELFQPETGEFAAVEAPEGRVKASPIARRLANKLGVDIANVVGTGPGGRVVKEDVEAAADSALQASAGHGEPTQAPAPLPEQPPEQLPAEPLPTGPAEPEYAFEPGGSEQLEDEQFTGEFPVETQDEVQILPPISPEPIPTPPEQTPVAQDPPLIPDFPPPPPPPAPAPQQAPPQPAPLQPAATQPAWPQTPQPPAPQVPAPQQFPSPAPFVPGMTGGFPAIQPQQPPPQPPIQPQQPQFQQQPYQQPIPQQPAMPQQPIMQQPAVPQPPLTQQPAMQQPPAQQPPVQPGAPTATRGHSTPIEPTNAQQTVARRMAESKATAPEFFVETEVDMTTCVAYREQLRSMVSPLPSFNDFVIKAAGQALRQYPNVNAAYKDGHFEQYSDVNVGIVVSATELLAVPTMFNVDQKGLAQIAAESQQLSEAVRTRTIQPSQMSGGTFSISNLGMYGVDRFTAILNPPQAAILAVGAINRRAVIAEDGMSLVIRQIMNMTLTCDHRILYGAEAAEFLGAIKAWLESPQLLQV